MTARPGYRERIGAESCIGSLLDDSNPAESRLLPGEYQILDRQPPPPHCVVGR
jgi:hypothetical protein